MIANRDRPIEDVQDALLETLGRDEQGRSLRRRGINDAVLKGPDTKIEDVIVDDETGRKERLVKTLDGNPDKGTVVIAVRGTDDSTDLWADLNIFTNSKSNVLKNVPIYKEIKEKIEQTLRTYFSPLEGSSNRSYLRNWDVFATGHSLGGAITDQLILDGVVNGGLSFSAPRTVSSKLTQPSYGIINARDGVVGRAFGQWDQPYDLVVPGVSYLEANTFTQHNMKPFLDPELTAVRVDQYPRYNDKLYKPSILGSGRAPQLHTMFDAAKNAYDNGSAEYKQNLEDFIRQGLLLPELTVYRKLPLSSKRATVHFYVYSTPKYDYLEMPIRSQIETAIRDIARGRELDDAKLAMMMNNF
jgi:hypothetical protein